MIHGFMPEKRADQKGLERVAVAGTPHSQPPTHLRSMRRLHNLRWKPEGDSKLQLAVLCFQIELRCEVTVSLPSSALFEFTVQN
jgi:hypothetical protein